MVMSCQIYKSIDPEDLRVRLLFTMNYSFDDFPVLCKTNRIKFQLFLLEEKDDVYFLVKKLMKVASESYIELILLSSVLSSYGNHSVVSSGLN